MIGKATRTLALALFAGAVALAALVASSAPVQAALSADEQATLDVVVAAEAKGDAAAQVAHIMASSLSGPQKSLALQWLLEGATDQQVAALTAAVIAAAKAAIDAGQPGTVSVLGTGLGQAYKALVTDGRSSAAALVMTATRDAVGEGGALSGASRQMAQLFATAFDAAAAGPSRSSADGGASEDQVDPGQTDTPRPPSPS